MCITRAKQFCSWLEVEKINAIQGNIEEDLYNRLDLSWTYLCAVCISSYMCYIFGDITLYTKKIKFIHMLPC